MDTTTNSSSSGSTRETWLPENLIMDILTRLPVKSLLRLKCVCKVWCKLVTSCYFITSYNTNHTLQKKVVSLYCESCRRSTFHCESCRSTTISFRLFDAPLVLSIRSPIEYLSLVGCSYGLVCFSLNSEHNELVVWNPATKLYRQIRNSGLGMYVRVPREQSDYLCSGFCFDPIANSFKLARIYFTPPIRRHFMSGVEVDIFRSSSNSWTRKRRVDFPCQFYTRGHITGVVTSVMRYTYWGIQFSDRKQGIYEYYILCFDIVDELFTRIELPSEDWYKYNNHLTRYRESLAVLVAKGSYPDQYFDVWVMNYCSGINGSWSKLLTSLPLRANLEYPVGFLSKDEVDWVVMRDFLDCFLYNLDTGETKAFSGCHNEDRLFLYCESLASVY